MKVVLALLACVAVSHAAFTGTLQQRAQPAVAQAAFKLRLASGRSAIANDVVAAVTNQVNSILSQIDEMTAHGTSLLTEAGQLAQQHLATALEALTALGGSAQAVIAGHYQTAQNTVNNVLGQIAGLLSQFGLGNGKNLAAIGNFVQNLDIAALQNAANAAFLQAQQLVASLNIREILQNALAQLFQQKGWFGDIFNTIGNAISDMGSAAWNHVTGQASAAWEQAVGMYNELTGHASNMYDDVQAMAHNFVQEVTATGSSITGEAATQIGLILGEHSAILGDYWGTVQEAIATANNRPQA